MKFDFNLFCDILFWNNMLINYFLIRNPKHLFLSDFKFLHIIQMITYIGQDLQHFCLFRNVELYTRTAKRNAMEFCHTFNDLFLENEMLKAI